MEPMSKWQNAVFILGALLMLIGAVSSIFRWPPHPYVFTAGAVCYAAMQAMQRYTGSSLTVNRLLRIQTLSGLLLVATGVLMYANAGNPFGLGQLDYLTYIHGKWVVTLLLAAILQLYTTYRIGTELEKGKNE